MRGKKGGGCLSMPALNTCHLGVSPLNRQRTGRGKRHLTKGLCRFEAEGALSGHIVECRLAVDCDEREAAVWTWIRMRPDKRSANYISVAESVLQSIREGITRQDLLRLEPQIRVNWKAREKSAPCHN